MTDEQMLRAWFDAATADLHAPRMQGKVRPAAVPPSVRPAATTGRRRRWIALTCMAAATGAAATAMLGLVSHSMPSNHHPGPVPEAGLGTPRGPAVLYRLAATVRARPTPAARYAVQIEQQNEGSSSYLKATIIDSRTGDTWTYQRGPGIADVLPMAPGFAPTEDQLHAWYPTDPAQLRAALIAHPFTDYPSPVGQKAPNDLAVPQAIDALWNPLVQPALRAALVSVIASSPGVTIDSHATDSEGRKSIEISYEDEGLGVGMSVYLDPSTGAVLESSQRPYAATADPNLAGSDTYLSEYWTDASPTIDPLKH